MIRRVNSKSAREQATGGENVPRGNIRRDAKGNIHIRRKAKDNMIF